MSDSLFSSPASVKQSFQKIAYWPELKALIDKNREEGFQAFIVGGAVRQALLNKEIGDVDLAVSARPESLLKLFPQAKGTFKKYGVLLIPLSRGKAIEITSFRKDSPYSDGRHPQSIEYSGIQQDASRRDFTINALFYDIQKDQIIDYFGGLNDLKKKLIKCIGKAETRFKEDYLRILRALRLAHQLNFKIESQTGLALLAHRQKVQKLSKERILKELNKMFQVGKLALAVELLRQYKLLPVLFPGDGGDKESMGEALSKFYGFGLKNPGFLTAFTPPLASLDEPLNGHLDKPTDKGEPLYQKENQTKKLLPDKGGRSTTSKKQDSSNQSHVSCFYQESFSFYKDIPFCWTLLGLPVFYNNKPAFQQFLNTYPLPKAIQKQSLHYWLAVKTLLDRDSSFADKLLAFNKKPQEVYALAKVLIYCSGLYRSCFKNPVFISLLNPPSPPYQGGTGTKPENLNRISTNNTHPAIGTEIDLDFYFNEFTKRAKNKQLAPALVTGHDLLKWDKPLKQADFSQWLKKAYTLQIENPGWDKSQILKKLLKNS